MPAVAAGAQWGAFALESASKCGSRTSRNCLHAYSEGAQGQRAVRRSALARLTRRRGDRRPAAAAPGPHDRARCPHLHAHATRHCRWRSACRSAEQRDVAREKKGWRAHRSRAAHGRHRTAPPPESWPCARAWTAGTRGRKKSAQAGRLTMVNEEANARSRAALHLAICSRHGTPDRARTPPRSSTDGEDHFPRRVPSRLSRSRKRFSTSTSRSSLPCSSLRSA